MDNNKNHVEEEEDLSFFDELNDLDGDQNFSKFMSQSSIDFSKLEQYMDDEMSRIPAQEMDDSVVVHVPHKLPTPSTMELPADVKEPWKKRSKSALEGSDITNHVEEEEDLSFFDELNDLDGDHNLSKFMSQSSIDFSKLEQYMDDEMSRIPAQEMDDSVVVHVPHKLPTPSTMELPADVKEPWKKRSKSALEESDVTNPRRSKRIMLRRASATKSENTRRVEEYLLEHKMKSLRVQARTRTTELATLEMKNQDLSNENTDLKKQKKTMVNQIHLQDAREDDIELGIQWLRTMASNPSVESMPFPFNPGNYADLLPNLQGYEHSSEAFLGFAGASSSATGGEDALPPCKADNNHSLNDSSGKNGLAEGSSKPAD
ncbi:hypothetical protein ACJRO7_030059 [Eucalyptus globulus]|uniref:BZIP domain-containing protein n=1 Tax=Eucalyptus globulus TaxID=34317 RepID=A0ABD3JCZ0_EUCGL